MSKALLVYYSRSGYTASLAKEIAGMTGWDVDEVRDVRSRVGAWGFVRSLFDVLLSRRPAIEPAAKKPESYDLVVLAAPVWMKKLAAPMRSYIVGHKGQFKALAFFCSFGGSGADNATQQVAALAGLPLKAALAVTDVEIDKADYRVKLDDFLRNLGVPPR